MPRDIKSTRLRDKIASAMGVTAPVAATVLDVIRNQIEQSPELIEEIFPGKALRKRPMTAEERAQRSVPAANAARRKATQRRYDAIMPEIEKFQKVNPDATTRDIASYLDEIGLKPLRGEKWSAASVWYMLNKAEVNK